MLSILAFEGILEVLSRYQGSEGVNSDGVRNDGKPAIANEIPATSETCIENH